MALFQKSVLRKFLNDLDKTKLQEAWQLFKNHFHNPDVQKHIWDSKEEEYQEGFVRDLFVNVLGYTLKPQPNYNLVLEKKTEADATKSDGAMLRGETVTGVIELKDTDTTELDSIEKQVFGYKHKHKNCVYAITSNFEKLRFYINDSIEYEEFDLFNLTEDGFVLLYLCLQQKNIENDVPLKIKQASVAEEEGVTKKLYAGYSTFKQQLFTNIAALNPHYNKLELFRKTQKLLDRFLFILFAEDRLLVPPNSVRVILEDWEKLKELDNYVPLYDRFKKYFGYLNKGHAGKHYDIYAYNGGLFAADEILDSIKIDDKLLYEGTKALSNYDFQSEVDVNILVHIFEHSLSEIEEVQAELEGKVLEKTKTKRKKDGVFYTPRYITKYIVENTVGELCRQKKEELKITDDEFAYRKRRDARENKLIKLDTYRKWLLELTICDPACGSGAFLNQALEFLITEHRYIDELRVRLLGEKMVMNDMETEILSHNLFGVDINEEAVEIARLSLWLRTAQKGRKLSDLSKNIKCGNSLIDDPAVAGDKAFNWKKEFPQVFGEYKESLSVEKKLEKPSGGKSKPELITPETIVPDKNEETGVTQNYAYQKITNQDLRITNDDNQIVNEPAVQYSSASNLKGGFDVVIGNPPYVTGTILKNENEFIRNQFKAAQYQLDLYVLFIEKGLSLVSNKGVLSFITPNSWLKNLMMSECRKFLLDNSNLISIVPNMPDVFDDASVDSLIFIATKKSKHLQQLQILDFKNQDFYYKHSLDQTEFYKNEGLVFSVELNLTIQKVIDKIRSNTIEVGKLLDVTRGINPYDIYTGQPKEVIKSEAYHSDYKKDDTFVPELRGLHISRYNYTWDGKHYISYGDWLAAPRDPKYFTGKRILFREILGENFVCTYIDEDFKIDRSVYIALHISDKYDCKFVLSILASKLLAFYFRYVNNEFDALFPKIRVAEFKKLPIKITEQSHQNAFIEKADIMLSKNKELHEAKKQLLKLLTSKYESLSISKKIEDWPSLSFKDFLKELTKQKIKLSLTEQTEWMQHFENEKAKANAIEQVIDATDKEIDQMVYKLYGLTEEEIKIVEGNN
jgi:type I restriction-modification system DNA methylase subunit